jgi:hypothetical protein
LYCIEGGGSDALIELSEYKREQSHFDGQSMFISKQGAEVLGIDTYVSVNPFEPMFRTTFMH